MIIEENQAPVVVVIVHQDKLLALARALQQASQLLCEDFPGLLKACEC